MDWESIRTREKKIYKGILFCKFEHKMEILLSPHYYRNNNLHNADDFRALDCISTIREIGDLFGIKSLEKWQVINIEYGLNFVLPNYGKELVVFAEYWKKTPFRYDTELAYSKKSYVVKKNGAANTYKIIKLYCKHSQFPEYCEHDTIRIEIKSKQSKYIERIGLAHLGHLLDSRPYLLMKQELIQLSRELLILDQKTGFENLSLRERRKLKEYLNTHTWYTSLQKSTNEFYKKKQRYFNLLNITGRNIHYRLQKRVTQKVDFLCNVEFEKGLNSTALPKNEKGLNSSNNIIGISPLLGNTSLKCKVTDIYLEHEGPGAIYIRTTTLRFLQKKHPEKFKQLRLDLLPANKNKHPKYEKDLISHMAKQVRNRYYNAKRKGQGGLPKQYKNQIAAKKNFNTIRNSGHM